MSGVRDYLQERKSEVGQHLSLLRILDRRSKETPDANDEDRIELRQVMIMKSSVLVHLYNIIESTMTRSLDELSEHVSKHHPRSYNETFFRAWMKFTARTHEGLAPESLLDCVTEVGKDLIRESQWAPLKIKKGLGNWDDKLIADLARVLAIPIDIEDAISRPAREHYIDNDSRMVYLRKKRNDLAHGWATFEDGARDRTVDELDYMAASILNYIEEIAVCFESFANNGLFLQEEGAAA